MHKKLWQSLFILYAIASGATALTLLVTLKANSLLAFPAFLAAEFLGAPWSFAFIYVQTMLPRAFETYAMTTGTCASLLINCWLAWRKGWGTPGAMLQANVGYTQPVPSKSNRFGPHLHRLSVIILIPGAFLLSYVYLRNWGKGGINGLPGIFYEMVSFNCWLFFVSRPTLLLSSIVPVLLVAISALTAYASGVPSLGALADMLWTMRQTLNQLLQFLWLWGIWSWLAAVIVTYVAGYIYVASRIHVAPKA